MCQGSASIPARRRRTGMGEMVPMSEATTTDAMQGVAAAAAADASDGGQAECWCCGQQYASERLVRLGSHPEVAVCLGCAHFLHRQARAREDALRPSISGRARDALRSVRRMAMDQGWHQRPLIGPPLRWLGRHLPQADR
jgi:hypothetical protein